MLTWLKKILVAGTSMRAQMMPGTPLPITVAFTLLMVMLLQIGMLVVPIAWVEAINGVMLVGVPYSL